MSKEAPEYSLEDEVLAISVADNRAALTRIPHYVLTNERELWVCGRGMRNALWAYVPAIYETT